MVSLDKGKVGYDMSKWRQALIALTAVSMMGVLMAGCTDQGGSGGEGKEGLEAEKGKKLSIMIPGHNPNSTDESMWQNAVVKNFKDQYPDVTVEFVIAGWDTWETKVLANAASEDPIDVINDGANNNPKFALKGITQPIQKYINLDNPNLHKATMDSVFKYGGNYYVAVSETNVAVIYYNKTMFENEGADDLQKLYEAGDWNWDNLTRIAKMLTDDKQKRFGLATNYPYILFGANQTSMLKLDDNSKYTLNISAPELRRSFELIQDAYYTSKWSGYDGDPWQTFYKGGAAMLMDFQWVDAQILDAKDFGLADFEYGVVPVPFGPDNSGKVSPITAAGWAMGNGSDCPYHAGKLIDMLVDGQAAFTAKANEKLDPAHVALYKELASRPYCTNSYDSAVGGAFDICGEIGEGKNIAQAIEEYKPVYQKMVDDANSATTSTEG